MQAQETPTAEAWLGGAFDFLCTRRIREIITPEQAEQLLHRVYSSDAMKSLLERVVTPGRDRVVASYAKSSLPLSSWLPDEARAKLAALLGRPVHVPKALVEELVSSPQVREEIRRMLQDALVAFVDSGINAAPVGKGVRGVMGLGMKAAGAVLGNLGGDRIEGHVRDFADKAVGRMLKQLASILLSRETARALGQWRGRTFERLLSRTEADAARLVSWAPLAELDELAPSILAHNAARDAVREQVRTETSHTLEALSDQTIGELCDDLGIRDLWRAAFVTQATPLLRGYLDSGSYPGAPGA